MRAARFLAIPALAAVALALVLGGGGGRTIQAEFTSARGLVPGNDVRIDGAPVGTVSGMSLMSNGRAMVSIDLDAGAPAPRADATAAIRPVDLIGDNYLSLDPGTAKGPLAGPIPASRTLDSPRLDDVLRAFGEPERDALKAMLVEAGIGLDDRGVDLNRAALALRPALNASDRVLTELSSQRANLRAFVSNADRAAGQAASRDRDLGRLVGALDATSRSVAARAAPLGRTLAGAPRTLGELRVTADRLAGTATAATPLARSLGRAAPELATASARLGPFLASASRAASGLEPTIAAAGTALERGGPTLASLAGSIGRIESVAPVVDRFLRVVDPAAPDISQGFFVNFPDQAAEPGTQPFDRFADPRRHYWRGAAVLTCQSFGVPIKPGCLQSFLNGDGSGKGPSKPTAPMNVPETPPQCGLRDVRGCGHGGRRPGSPSSPGPHPSTGGGPGTPNPPPPPDLPSAVHDLLNFLTAP